MSTQPEALVLADAIDAATDSTRFDKEVSLCLRLQHAEIEALHKWQSEGEALVAKSGVCAAFMLGRWWADRPWRSRTGTTATEAACEVKP